MRVEKSVRGGRGGMDGKWRGESGIGEEGLLEEVVGDAGGVE